MAAYGEKVSRDDWLLPKQAAAEIGMSVEWLRQKIKAGNGPPYKRRGRLYLISRTGLMIWDQQTEIP